jgi:disulfide bond formation protein DsbB
MTLQTAGFFFALLALAANAATIGIVAIGLFGKTGAGAGTRRQLFSAFEGIELWLAFGVAATATLGSLYLSEIAHLIPCTLCWYQRIAMYPLAVILLIAAIRRDHGIRIYVTPLAIIGAVIAIYHRFIQLFPNLEGGTSCDPSVPCSAAYIEMFGFVTVPYMALSGFLLIVALMWLDRFNSSPAPASLPQIEPETHSS